jgi:ATPase subunit of ABC transporter with duplicated ATPase domains
MAQMCFGLRGGFGSIIRPWFQGPSCMMGEYEGAMAQKEHRPATLARDEKKKQLAAEAEQVWAQVGAEAQVLDDNTARLRALRLERDRQEAADAPAPKKRAPAKPKIRRAKSSP